jgi:hypothetical protein
MNLAQLEVSMGKQNAKMFVMWFEAAIVFGFLSVTSTFTVYPSWVTSMFELAFGTSLVGIVFYSVLYFSLRGKSRTAGLES